MSGRRPGGGGRALRGLLRLAFFRADGLDEFTASRQAFLNSLAPLIAFPLVGGMMMLASGGGLSALADLLATAVALLAPPVLSHAFAVLWRREALWLRYAVAFNWCQWAVPLAAVAVLVVTGALVAMGLPQRAGAPLAMLALAAYGLGLHWFLARHGLEISRWRAVLFVLVVNMVTGALVLGPPLLMAILYGVPGGVPGR